MKKRTQTTLATLLLIASALACNLPGSGEQVPPPGGVQTSAALTVEALLVPPATSTQPQEPQAASTVTTTPTVGPTGTITPTYSVPMLRVLQQTNCRTGPGQDYEIVYTYLAWKELEIVGAYPQDDYWLVKSDESPTGECWLWGEYVEVRGSYWVVASVTPPPTATQPAPLAPSIQNWTFDCSFGQVKVVIEWSDRANNEAGYRVIRDNQAVAQLPADSNTYTESIPYNPGDTFLYYIDAYNPTGSTRSTPVQFTCP